MKEELESMLNKVARFIGKNWILLLILIVGLGLRSYKPLELFMYSHDQDLAGWMVKDVVVNHHIRLIGQETSSHGIFIGPLYYYLEIPFYLLANMDPAGPLFLSIILGVLSIFSFYYVFLKIFNKRTGLIAALIYAVSTMIIFTDREVVPTTPVMLWSVWYFYSVWELFKGKQKFYLLIGILFGLVWNISLALAVLSPLVILAQILSKKRLNFKYLLFGVSAFFVLMLPFMAFEARHSFQQTKSLLLSFTTQKDYVPGTGTGFAKLDRVLQLVHTNTTNLYWNNKIAIKGELTFYALILLFVLLLYKRIMPIKMGLLMFLWQILYLIFFTFNSINVSEYYLNGMNIVWIGILALAISASLENKNLKYLGLAALFCFVLINLSGFLGRKINRSGYLERKAIVNYIDNDAREHGYPCVSVSYITSPGNEFGYRYLFWLKDMHVNQPISGSPVYSIVYPLEKVDRVDKTFGVLGLILPDYERYTKKEVEISCSGANSNLTDPMFGYTQ